MNRLYPVAVLWMVGCKSEQGLGELGYDSVAVATGDFDHFEAFLGRHDVAYTPFEGFISQATYDPEIDPDAMSLKTESLFTGVDGDGDSELLAFDAVFVNSGTRGFGAYVYNGVDSDDALVTDPTTAENLDVFLLRHRALIVSDWAYDLIEMAWPDRIAFLDDEQGLDAAQRGTSDSVIVDVVDAGLADALDADQISLEFDFTYWTVMTDVADEVTVYLRGDVDYRVSEAEGEGRLVDVPLLVGFNVGGGTVLYSSFHWRSQNDDIVDTILMTVLSGLSTGTEEDGSGG